MTYDYEPHSKEWFDALRAFNPQQAEQTERMLRLAGSNDVCSVCGDKPSQAYRIVAPPPVDKAVATIRLCKDCHRLRSTMHHERYKPLASSSS